jgi:glycosyltransferase involved in cell wall biosynthesis
MILYLAHIGSGDGSSIGVINKILGQVKAIKKFTSIKCIIYYSKTRPVISESSLKDDILIVPNISNYKIYRRFKMVKSYNLFSRLYSDANILIRFQTIDPFFLIYLFFNRKRKLFFERQSKELYESILTASVSNFGFSLFDYLMYPIASKFIDGEIAVTKEIAEYLKRRNRTGKIIVVPNGIESRYINTFPKFDVSTIKLCFAGNITKWSGLNYLIYELERIQFKLNGANLILYIIGEGICLRDIKMIAENINQKANIKFLGALNGEEKEKVLLESNIGISSLNSKRRHLKEGSNLKNREYCLFGLPFIKVDSDPDFDNKNGTCDFFRNINDRGDIINKLSELVEVLYTKNEIRYEMNDYANKYLSWDTKIKAYINMIEK